MLETFISHLTIFIVDVKLYTEGGKKARENTGFDCGFYAIFFHTRAAENGSPKHNNSQASRPATVT
jgi:hypothetical protein